METFYHYVAEYPDIVIMGVYILEGGGHDQVGQDYQ